MQSKKPPHNSYTHYIEIKYNTSKKEKLKNPQSQKIIKNFKNLKVSNLLKLVGENKNFQKRIIVLITICIYLLSFQNYYQAYIFYYPKFFCYNENNILKNCDYKEACKKKNFEIFLEKKSLITKFSLFCEKDYIVALIESATFFCAAFFSLFFSIISDYLGRRKILIFSCFFFLLGNFFCYYVITLEFLILGLILSFSGQDMITSVFYVYFSETMGNKFRNRTSGIIFFAFVSGNLSLLFINFFINDFEDIFFIVFIQSVLLCFLSFYFFETPFIYYSQKDLLGLYKNLNHISEINNENNLYLQKKDKLKKKLFLNSSINLQKLESYKIIKNPKNLKKQKKTKNKFQNYKLKILNISLLMIPVYFSSGMFLVAPQNLGIKSLSINLSLTSIGEILGYLFMTIYSKNFKRKNFFQIHLIIYYFFCLLLFSFTIFKIRHFFFIQIFETFISMLLKFNMSIGFCMIFVYIAEIFPTNIRGFTIGFSILLGRISVSFSSLLAFWGSKYNIHPLFFCMIFALVAQIPLIYLPETFEKQIKN